MPNGYQREWDEVWKRSRFWGVVWQTGDMLYYFGLMGSLLAPLAFLNFSPGKFESWGRALSSLGIAICLLIGCFPIGLVASLSLKWIARRGTGVEGH